MICLKCNKKYPSGKNYCANCGEPLVEEPKQVKMEAPNTGRVCRVCNKVYRPEAKFCGQCGGPLEPSEAPVVAESVPTPVPTPTPAPEPAPMLSSTPEPAPAPMPTPAPVPIPTPTPMSAESVFGNDDQATVMHNSAPVPEVPEPVFGNDDQATVMHNSAPVPEVLESVYGNDDQATVMHNSAPDPVGTTSTGSAVNLNHHEVPEIKSLNAEFTSETKTTQKRKSKESPDVKVIVLTVVAILLFLLIVGLGLLIFKSGMFSSKSKKGDKEEKTTEVIEQEEEISLEEIAALLSDADELVELGLEQIESDETVYDGLNSLEEAIETYLEKLPEIGDPDYIVDKIDIAYSAYQTAVYSRVSMLNENAIGGVDTGSRFEQMIEDLEYAIAIGDKIADAGFEVNYEDIEALIDEIREEYPKRVIEEFNTYSGEKLVDGNWSRTETYNLMCGNEDMVGTEGMFDPDDFDDPVHTRYCFALAYYQVKLLNKAVHEEKTQTPGAAAKSIAGILPAVDYSPLLISQYVAFRKEAGLDCEEAELALNDVKTYLNDDYGIDIDAIGWEHFWYFNELGSDSSETVADGDWNGVTPESRQWIRERLSAVSY